MLQSVALLALLFAAGCGAQEADVPVAAAAAAEAPTAAAAEATLVDTAQGLRDAIRAGAPHIVITEHLDLSQAPPDDKTSNFLSSYSAGTPSDDTLSIRGACDAPPPPQLLRPSDAPLRPGQCVLSAPKHRVFFWSYKPKPLWLDNLYVRAAPAGSRKSVLSMGVLEMVDALWLSRVTFQDVSPPGGPALDRSPYAVLHLANCTQVLVQDCAFQGFELSAIDAWDEAIVSVVHSAFLRLTAPTYGALFVNGASRIRFEGCRMSNITGLHFHITGVEPLKMGRRSTLYTDAGARIADGTWKSDLRHVQSVLPLTAGGAVPWLLPGDLRLATLREAADAAAAAAGVEVVADEPGMSPLFVEPPPPPPPPPPAPPPPPPRPTSSPAVALPPPSPPNTPGPVPDTNLAMDSGASEAVSAPGVGTDRRSGSGGDQDNTGAIAGGIAAVAVAVVMAMVCAFLVARRRRHPQRYPGKPTRGSGSDAQSSEGGPSRHKAAQKPHGAAPGHARHPSPQVQELRTSRAENTLAAQRTMSLTDTSVASGKCAPQQPAHAVVASQDTAATDLGQSVLTASSAPSVVARTPPDRSVIGPGTNVSSAPRWAPPELHTTAGGSVSPLPARSAGGAFQGSNVAHQYPTGGVQSSEASSGMPGARQHGLSSNWAVAGGASAPDATAATTSRGLESEHTSHERTLTKFPAQFPPMLHMSSHEDKGSMGATPPVTAGALHARQGSAGSEARAGRPAAKPERKAPVRRYHSPRGKREAEQALEQLIIAVETMAYAEPQELFAANYWLSTDMVQGGQGLVVFARSRGAGMRQHAIKFFLSRRDFLVESAFYERELFRACLPQLLWASTDGDTSVVSRAGYEFPPFLVLDRGLTLEEWAEARRAHSAVATMAAEVLALLGMLHRAGSVHRDVKPANLLLVLHTQRWRLLDLGIVAAVGERLPISCTLTYAPPEAVVAHARGADLTVAPSLDIWAMGVVVYECLTGQRVFPRYAGAAGVLACAERRALYPWERPAEELPEAWLKARVRPVVQQCLARDPADRPSAFEALRGLQRLDSVTTQSGAARGDVGARDEGAS